MIRSHLHDSHAKVLFRALIIKVLSADLASTLNLSSTWLLILVFQVHVLLYASLALILLRLIADQGIRWA
jgi:hypothetical protein